MKPQPLTKKQNKIFNFIKRYFIKNHAIPSCRIIADEFGYSSANAAFEHVSAICKKGYMEKLDGGSLKFRRIKVRLV